MDAISVPHSPERAGTSTSYFALPTPVLPKNGIRLFGLPHMSLSCTPSLSGWTVGVGGRRVEFGHSGIDRDGSPSSSSDEGHSRLQANSALAKRKGLASKRTKVTKMRGKLYPSPLRAPKRFFIDTAAATSALPPQRTKSKHTLTGNFSPLGGCAERGEGGVKLHARYRRRHTFIHWSSRRRRAD